MEARGKHLHHVRASREGLHSFFRDSVNEMYIWCQMYLSPGDPARLSSAQARYQQDLWAMWKRPGQELGAHCDHLGSSPRAPKPHASTENEVPELRASLPCQKTPTRHRHEDTMRSIIKLL